MRSPLVWTSFARGPSEAEQGSPEGLTSKTMLAPTSAAFVVPFNDRLNPDSNIKHILLSVHHTSDTTAHRARVSLYLSYSYSVLRFRENTEINNDGQTALQLRGIRLKTNRMIDSTLFSPRCKHVRSLFALEQ